MRPLRPEEEWARRVVECRTGVTVHANDDGTAPGMFDLRIGPSGAPDVAIEVTAAIDELWTETWDVGAAQSIAVPGLRSDWIVRVQLGASVKRIKRELPTLLVAAHARGLTTIAATGTLAFYEPNPLRLLEELGVAHAQCSRMDGGGKLYLTMQGQGGAVDTTGHSLPAWVSSFLSADERADVLRKLSATTAARREVFVAVTLMGAPWNVTSYLTNISRREHALPPASPDLPEPVTGDWVTSTLSFGEALGVHWDGSKWSTFRSRGDGIDDESR